MKKILPLLILMLLSSSCGLIMSEEEGTEKTQDTSASEFQVSEENVDKPEQQIAVADNFEESVIKPSEEMRAPVEPRQEEFENKPMAEIAKPAMGSQEFGSYKVEKSDTLMMVAFRIYGDYHKWKELKAWNKAELKNGMHAGMFLKYTVPEKKFVWNPTGLPYLVKEGNTLGTISNEKYGTPKKWKDLYENNRPLIQNPNVIFAGFTIYYVPVRDIASQKE